MRCSGGDGKFHWFDGYSPQLTRQHRQICPSFITLRTGDQLPLSGDNGFENGFLWLLSVHRHVASVARYRPFQGGKLALVSPRIIANRLKRRF